MQPPAITILASGCARATKAGARHAPLAPGCYVFRDRAGTVLYVGKSVALRHRLASYFVRRDQLEGKTRAMIGRAYEVEWHTVGSEVQALILESQLIKTYLPPYNVLGRDYPHYTFIRFNTAGSAAFPYLEVCRTVDDDGGTYYGPFWGQRSAEQTIEFVNRLFKLRHCSGTLPPAEVGRGCLYAQIRRCSAPCLGRTTAADYGAAVRGADELLRGDIAQLITRLEGERDAAAEELRFEQAAALHRIIQALHALRSKRRHLRSAANTLNFLVVVRQVKDSGAEVLAFSAARLQGQLSLAATPRASERAALQHFILEQYPARRRLAIDLDELDQMHIVAEWLTRRDRRAVYLPLPDGPLTPDEAQQAADTVVGILGQ